MIDKPHQSLLNEDNNPVKKRGLISWKFLKQQDRALFCVDSGGPCG